MDLFLVRGIYNRGMFLETPLSAWREEEQVWGAGRKGEVNSAKLTQNSLASEPRAFPGKKGRQGYAWVLWFEFIWALASWEALDSMRCRTTGSSKLQRAPVSLKPLWMDELLPEPCPTADGQGCVWRHWCSFPVPQVPTFKGSQTRYCL